MTLKNFRQHEYAQLRYCLFSVVDDGISTIKECNHMLLNNQVNMSSLGFLKHKRVISFAKFHVLKLY